MNTFDDMGCPIRFWFNKREMRRHGWIDAQDGQLEKPCQISNRRQQPTKSWRIGIVQPCEWKGNAFGRRALSSIIGNLNQIMSEISYLVVEMNQINVIRTKIAANFIVFCSMITHLQGS